MQIQLNGDSREISEGANLQALVDTLDLAGKRFAIEVNEQIIPRSRHKEHILQANDLIEVVQAIGGG